MSVGVGERRRRVSVGGWRGRDRDREVGGRGIKKWTMQRMKARKAEGPGWG